MNEPLTKFFYISLSKKQLKTNNLLEDKHQKFGTHKSDQEISLAATLLRHWMSWLWQTTTNFNPLIDKHRSILRLGATTKQRCLDFMFPFKSPRNTYFGQNDMKKCVESLNHRLFEGNDEVPIAIFRTLICPGCFNLFILNALRVLDRWSVIHFLRSKGLIAFLGNTPVINLSSSSTD